MGAPKTLGKKQGKWSNFSRDFSASHIVALTMMGANLGAWKIICVHRDVFAAVYQNGVIFMDSFIS